MAVNFATDVLRNLTKTYGRHVAVYRPTKTVNVETGVETETVIVYPLTVLPVLSTLGFKSFSDALRGGGNFGSLVAREGRTLLFAQDDLVITPNLKDYVTSGGKRYQVLKVETSPDFKIVSLEISNDSLGTMKLGYASTRIAVRSINGLC
jgi:hypothetical protein